MSPRDQTAFVERLALVVVLLTVGVLAQIYGGPTGIGIGIGLLAATYTHMVELQHQCLHHSAFQSSRLHRIVGVPLGLPLLVSYSDYRVRHLQHHRYLGTENDSEFFGFDTRKPITWASLLAGAFDYKRLVTVFRSIVLSTVNRWEYTDGQISPRRRKEVNSEYRLMGVLLISVAAVSIAGGWREVVQFWLVPLLFAAPIHFLVELPEHTLCEPDTQDVLRNTRSITGSRLTAWFTNGNNLHVEHHAAMTVPINRLRERHPEVQRLGRYVDQSYINFYWRIVKVATRNTVGQAATVMRRTGPDGESSEAKKVRINWLRF